MPKEYEAMRDRLISQGMSVKNAKEEAARTWNKRHPDNPNPWRNEIKRGPSLSNYGRRRTR
jgi:hypothetical protein